MTSSSSRTPTTGSTRWCRAAQPDRRGDPLRPDVRRPAAQRRGQPPDQAGHRPARRPRRQRRPGRPAQGQRRRDQRALPQARRRPEPAGLRHHGAGRPGVGHGRPPVRLRRLPVPRRSAATAARARSPIDAHRRPRGHRRLAAVRLELAGRAVRDVRQGPRGAVLGKAVRAGARDGGAVHPPASPPCGSSGPCSAQGHRLLRRDGRGRPRRARRSGVRRRRGHRRDLPVRAGRGSRTPSCSRRAPGSGWCAPIRRWARAYAVGHASPAEIDAIGIMAALRLAGHPRAGRSWTSSPTWSSSTATTTG